MAKTAKKKPEEEMEPDGNAKTATTDSDSQQPALEVAETEQTPAEPVVPNDSSEPADNASGDPESSAQEQDEKYERAKAAPTHLLDLQRQSLPELMEVAATEGIEETLGGRPSVGTHPSDAFALLPKYL